MRREAGGAVPLALMVVALVTLVGVATASLGAVLAAREQAFIAAEAAALAAAVATYPPAASEHGPSSAARVAARANGASLVKCLCRVDGSLRARAVEVSAKVVATVPILGEVGALGQARAEFDPLLWLGS